MIRACLFDLDGTLLPMDLDKFTHEYLKALADYLKDHIEPKQFVSLLWQATEEMIKNQDETLTNEQVFEQAFLRLTGLTKEVIWPRIEQFYLQEFPKLKIHTEPNPLVRKVVEAALEKGYLVAVATNPIFPRMAILERLRWAGIEDLPFSLVTVYEENHFCKPQAMYYLEVARRIGVRPEECVMIGNDMQEDLVAKTVGMKTFYVKQCRIDRGNPTYPFDQEGTLEELLDSILHNKGVFA